MLFAVILCICDFLVGWSMEYITDHIEVGGQGRDNYICNKTEDNLLIFGSSRAVHHYNASIFADSLELSSYNCGEDGNGIILGYGRLLMVKERHQPKVIIYDVNPTYDIEKNDNSQYLGYLRARYHRKGISLIFDDVDKNERYKMMCQMYRYNSKFLQTIFTFLTGKAHDDGIKGFRPLKGVMDKMKIRGAYGNNTNKKPQVATRCPLKERYISNFISLCKGSKTFFVVSPSWYGITNENKDYIKEMCNKNNVVFIDFSNDPKYVHQDVYFKDGSHLNEKGADEFTKDLIQIIKTHI